MHPDDRDDHDPIEDILDEIERVMNEMMGGDVRVESGGGVGPDVHLDVYEDEGRLRVVADLPGVEKADISLRCDGTTLTIDAESDRREYHERVDLPLTVDEHSAEATYNNGILEVTLETVDDSANIDVT